MTIECVSAPGRREADAAQQEAVGDAGGGEHHVARAPALRSRTRDRGRRCPCAMARSRSSSLRGLQHALHVAAHAAQSGRRQNALGRAAGAQQDVDAGRRVGGGQRAADVAVGDEADARAGLAHLGDQRVVARAIEDDGGQIARRATRLASAIAARLWVALLRMSIAPARNGPDGDLVHVRVGRVQELSVLGHRHHRQRVGERRSRPGSSPPADRPRCRPPARRPRRRPPARRCRASAPRRARPRR